MIKMLKLLLSCCALGFLSNAVAAQNYSLCYEVGSGTESCMDVMVDWDKNLIHYHMVETGDFEDVDTLEDYNTGYAASRVASQDACYVRRLVSPMEQEVDNIQNHQQSTQSVDSTGLEVLGIPLDNPEEEVGQTLADFCGDLPVYKMVKKDGDDGGDGNDVSKRQVSVTFRRCLLFFFFFAKCFTTTLTVPTGSTITFIWFFG